MSNSEEFDEFYERCRARLVTQIFVFTGDESESRDFVQQAFERAWKYWSRVSALEDREAWVRLVAFNLAKDHLRRNRNISLHSTVPRAPSDSIEDEEGLIGFGKALARLTTQQRRALILYHLVGLTVREIADEMSTQPGTVMSWLFRGRANLATALEALEATDVEETLDRRRP